ncbi:hypothetical protein M2272_002932 [Mycobacterium frederiksbergense]|uniref:DUF4190 domain-containing protein n=1 Tax=Mycolicibacterium frederiksbergense TaxID=117567 RepID=A0ABT6L017_9MYCO|nr:DUF4190 domain-containing protein [Mycolicibacterium frederiksbergense]MDH6196289.1 hypothetical protein [Mycolicibacterium frederiksbergense]
MSKDATGTEIVVTYGEHGSGSEDPFAADPYAAPTSLPGYGQLMPTYGPPMSYGQHDAPPPKPEVNTFATLSVVFAFVFAPAGAVLGHLALARIKRGHEPGRKRAVLGLTLSYAIMALTVIALVVWLILGPARNNSGTTTVTTTTVPTPRVISTVVTPPPRSRPTVSVENLRQGDCIEVQTNAPVAGQPNTDHIYLYRAQCEVRDGVFQVRQLVGNEDACLTTNVVFNVARTVFACIDKFGG